MAVSKRCYKITEILSDEYHERPSFVKPDRISGGSPDDHVSVMIVFFCRLTGLDNGN